MPRAVPRRPDRPPDELILPLVTARAPRLLGLQQPTTNGGATYPQMQFETDAPATEASCIPTGQGCAVPPPGAPGNFYPYFTQALVGVQCVAPS